MKNSFNFHVVEGNCRKVKQLKFELGIFSDRTNHAEYIVFKIVPMSPKVKYFFKTCVFIENDAYKFQRLYSLLRLLSKIIQNIIFIHNFTINNIYGDREQVKENEYVKKSKLILYRKLTLTRSYFEIKILTFPQISLSVTK